MKYIILANGSKNFLRHMIKINGEAILHRTIRLLKENGVKEIYISTELYNIENAIKPDYEYTEGGIWLDAISPSLLIEPIAFIFGDVYFTNEAIKTIVETEVDKTTMFGTNISYHEDYIKKYDEPFGFKVIDCKEFKKHIDIVREMFRKGEINRNPISWELYRSLNGYDVNKHIIGKNYVSINDISCDIDNEREAQAVMEYICGK